MLVANVSNPVITTQNLAYEKSSNVFAQKLQPLASDTFEKTSFSGKIHDRQETVSGFTELDIECRSSFKSFLHRKNDVQNKQSALEGFSKFDVEEYKTLGMFEKIRIRKELNRSPEITEAARLTSEAAEIIKKEFDKKYGKGNYVYISIGRSCSTVVKALEYMGVESKIAPASRLMDTKTQINTLFENEGLGEYINFLYGIGLSPQEVQNSGKHYIFQDYTISGKSLRAFEDLIRSERVGLNFKNIHFESINKEFERLDSKYEVIYPYFNKKQFIAGLACCNYKKYSTVGRLNYKNMGDIKQAIYPNFKISDKAKLFNFALIDELKAKKLLSKKTAAREKLMVSK